MLEGGGELFNKTLNYPPQAEKILKATRTAA